LHSPAVLVLVRKEARKEVHKEAHNEVRERAQPEPSEPVPDKFPPEKLFHLQAVSTEASRLALAIRQRFQQNNLRSALEIASRAVAAGERITVSIDGASHFGEDSPPGVLIAAPFRTSRSQGAILVYPRAASPFTQEDKTLVSALAGFGAVAVANAELYGMARAQAHELHEILEISFELGSAGKLDQFMQTSAVRAASFLGFKRCFIGLLEQEIFHIRWQVENGAARPVDIPLYEGAATHALKKKSVFVTEDAAKTPGANLDFLAAFQIRQLLAVPLLGSNGDVLGMFGVLDRLALGPINDDDVRRARALAAQVAIALELTRNLHQSEEHRRRAEALVTLALELNTVLHLPEFMRSFVRRAASLFRSPSAALCLFQTPEPDTVVLSAETTTVSGSGVWKRQRAAEGLRNRLAARRTKLRMNSGRCNTVFSSRARVTRASARRRCSSDWWRLRVNSRAMATCAARARARRTSSSLMGPRARRSSTPNIPSTSPFEPRRGTARSWRIWNAARKSKFAPGVLAASSVTNTLFFFRAWVAAPSYSGISTGRAAPFSTCQRMWKISCSRRPMKQRLKPRKLAARTAEVCMNWSSFPADPSSKEISRISWSSWAWARAMP